MSPHKNADAPVIAAESRNIEIKARLGNDEQFERRVQIARKLTSTEGKLIEQHDVFYNVTQGRLKLRFLKVSENIKIVDTNFGTKICLPNIYTHTHTG